MRVNYPIIETNRLTLRRLDNNDTGSIFQYRSDKYTNRYQSWIPNTPQDVINWIDNISPLFNQVDTWPQVVVIHNTTNAIVGDAGM